MRVDSRLNNINISGYIDIKEREIVQLLNKIIEKLCLNIAF